MKQQTRALLLAAALLLAVIAAYLPAIRSGFIWDDDLYVVKNATLRDGAGLKRIWLEPGATPQYYPLVHTLFWIQHRLWGLAPAGYHAVNVVLHGVNASLAGVVLARLGVPGAWLAAALFALHPVHVESVAWVTELKNVLSGFFFLSALLAYLRFDRLDGRGGAEAPRAGRRSRRAYLAALLLFLGALFSKTVVLTLPLTILLLIWWKRGRLGRGDFPPLLPFAALGAALGSVTAWMEKTHVGAEGLAWSYTFTDRVLIAGRALWFYLGKLVLPVRLSFVYPRWEIDAQLWWQHLYPAAFAALLAALYLGRRRFGRGPFTAAVFFAVTLGPALGFVDFYPMIFSFVADHFQYLASLGPLAFAAAVAARATGAGPGRHATGGHGGEPRPLPPRLVATGACLILPLALLTWQQTHVYHDVETLWRDTLAKNPGAWLAHTNLGMVLKERGDFPEALRHLRASFEINPDSSLAPTGIGDVLLAEKNPEEALRFYRLALQVNVSNFFANQGVGIALTRLGRLEEARFFLLTAMRLQPREPWPHFNYANLLAKEGRLEEAAASYRAAIALAPQEAEFHRSLGMAYALLRRPEDARREQALAQRLRQSATR